MSSPTLLLPSTAAEASTPPLRNRCTLLYLGHHLSTNSRLLSNLRSFNLSIPVPPTAFLTAFLLSSVQRFGRRRWVLPRRIRFLQLIWRSTGPCSRSCFDDPALTPLSRRTGPITATAAPAGPALSRLAALNDAVIQASEVRLLRRSFPFPSAHFVLSRRTFILLKRCELSSLSTLPTRE